MTRRRWLGASLGLNLILGAALAYAALPDRRGPDLAERHVAGDELAADKIAIVQIRGGLLEGTSGFAFAQIERAARDPAVRAVVVRVESPGGTVTAADRLHQALEQLRDNTHSRFAGSGPKPLTASFGSVAASGGYYLAMPCAKIYAEPTCITGSIGVFAALPNAAELTNRNGVKLIVIKAGDIKAGGSPLAPLTPADRQPWHRWSITPTRGSWMSSLRGDPSNAGAADRAGLPSARDTVRRARQRDRRRPGGVA